jgi:single-strand DNA-binding protein
MQLIGFVRLGRDAELRTTNTGETVATLALVYNHGKKGGDGYRPSQWVEGTLWGKQAEALASYLLKGKGLCVTIDDAHTEAYPKRDGTQGVKLVGRVSNVELAGDSKAASGQSDGAGAAPQPQQPPRTHSPAPAYPSRVAPPHTVGEDDQDIPF